MLLVGEGVLTGVVEPHLNTDGPGPAPRAPLLLRAVILRLHWHRKMIYEVIGELLGVKESTARESAGVT